MSQQSSSRIAHWSSPPGHRGFTLLEVLIALIIFALCASTLIQQSGRSIRQAAYLETRIQANWIAENELERLRLSEQFVSPGIHQSELAFGKRQWLISQEVTNTSHPDLRKAVIRVQEASNQSAGQYELTGFLGRY